MHRQARAARPAACIESLWQDPYFVKLYGTTVPPSCLMPVSCSLSLPLSHTLTPAHRGAPPAPNPCPGHFQRCGRCPRLGPGCSRRGMAMGSRSIPLISPRRASPPASPSCWGCRRRRRRLGEFLRSGFSWDSLTKSPCLRLTGWN